MRDEDRRLLNAVRRPEVYEDVLIESAGAPVVLSVWRAEPGPGSGTVVFLPGTMTHPLFYEPLLDTLAAEGFNAVGVHYQAHGKSPRDGRPLLFRNLVANARDAVSWALERFGHAPIVLGSSQGGILALALAGEDERLAAVFAHNALDTRLPESIAVTRYPDALAGVYAWIPRMMDLVARVAPRLPLPLRSYLRDREIFGERWTRDQFYADPIGRTSYPLEFLASLFSADLSAIDSGAIRCPVVVIAATGDPLFPVAYMRRVHERIRAPHKEWLEFPLERHLILNECLPEVLPGLLEALRRYAKPPA